MRDKILIIGGYGAVGRTIALTLANELPGKVIVAGRSFEKATALAQESDGKIRPLRFDLMAEDTMPDVLENVAVVVVCLDAPIRALLRNVCCAAFTM